MGSKQLDSMTIRQIKRSAAGAIYHTYKLNDILVSSYQPTSVHIDKLNAIRIGKRLKNIADNMKEEIASLSRK